MTMKSWRDAATETKEQSMKQYEYTIRVKGMAGAAWLDQVVRKNEGFTIIAKNEIVNPLPKGLLALVRQGDKVYARLSPTIWKDLSGALYSEESIEKLRLNGDFRVVFEGEN